MPVIEGRVDEILQRRELMKVAHETHGVECRRLQDDLDIVIMSVQSRAGMVGGKAADKMRGGKAEALADPVHGGASPDQARWRGAGPTTGPADGCDESVAVRECLHQGLLVLTG